MNPKRKACPIHSDEMKLAAVRGNVPCLGDSAVTRLGDWADMQFVIQCMQRIKINVLVCFA
jgi:hypothetical protein